MSNPVRVVPDLDVGWLAPPRNEVNTRRLQRLRDRNGVGSVVRIDEKRHVTAPAGNFRLDVRQSLLTVCLSRQNIEGQVRLFRIGLGSDLVHHLVRAREGPDRYCKSGLSRGEVESWQEESQHNQRDRRQKQAPRQKQAKI